MTLKDLAQKHPDYPVRLIFEVEGQRRGFLDCTISHALDPNASDRFFPPEGFRAADMAWPAPWYYKSEIVMILDLKRRDKFGYPTVMYDKVEHNQLDTDVPVAV